MKEPKEKMVKVKWCSSFTCDGDEQGCNGGDCLMSNYFKKTAKWKKITLTEFELIYNRKPR